MSSNQEQQGRIDDTNENNNRSDQESSPVSTSVSTFSSVGDTHGAINDNDRNQAIVQVQGDRRDMLMTRRRLEQQQHEALEGSGVIPKNNDNSGSATITTINATTTSLFHTHRPTAERRGIRMLRSFPYRMNTTTDNDFDIFDTGMPPSRGTGRVSSWGKLDLLAVLEEVEQILDEDDTSFGYNDDDTWKEFCHNLPLQ